LIRSGRPLRVNASERMPAANRVQIGCHARTHYVSAAAQPARRSTPEHAEKGATAAETFPVAWPIAHKRRKSRDIPWFTCCTSSRQP
jgi:hypothetical protein